MSVCPPRKKGHRSLTVLITGANGTIGWKLVRRCLLSGDTVIALDRHSGPAEPASKLLYYQADVSDAKRLDDIVDLVAIAVKGILDVIINLAAVCERRPLMECEDRAMVDAFQINVLAPWRVTKAFLPLLKKSRDPVVVNFSAEGGVMHPGLCSYPYLGSKIALDTLTRAMRLELSYLNIAVVSCIPPMRDVVVHNDTQCTGTSPYHVAAKFAQGILTALLTWRLRSVDVAGIIFECIHSLKRPARLHTSRNPFTRLFGLIPTWLHDTLVRAALIVRRRN
eukprot:GEMP01053104.1.p1 GENE.GEMP01053104.1~~GEMP01053104.1.p1  ORF type:complete len:280 (+),score=50.80 GEMP01053104.1:132-971(+)